MSENQFMAINRLPSKTWYWLKLNETYPLAGRNQTLRDAGRKRAGRTGG
ncbi:MAG: hypothetical protein ACLR4A_14140 [Christensenellales bacterium]